MVAIVIIVVQITEAQYSPRHWRWERIARGVLQDIEAVVVIKR